MVILLKYWKALLLLSVVIISILYFQVKVQEAKQEVRIEHKVEQQQDYIEGRKGIDNATKDIRGIGSDAALEWLRNRTPSSTN